MRFSTSEPDLRSLPIAILLLVSTAQALPEGQAAEGMARPHAQESSPEPRAPLVLEGFVLAPDGNPAEGAVVVSSAGGRALTDVAGNYRLVLEAPLDVTSVQLTATAGAGSSLSAAASVPLTGGARGLAVDPLRLALGGSCSSWQPLFGAFGDVGTGAEEIRSLCVFDDGHGQVLYAGGSFTTAGGAGALGLARWTGSYWLGLDVGGWVEALAVYGPALYVGGSFTSAGGVGANRIARWDGASWSALGSGTNGTVSALAVYDDGSGPALYAGGSFTTAGGLAANRIAKWNGASWSALGSGTNDSVSTLAVYDDGSGLALYAGGAFSMAGGVAANRIARWDGASWSALGTGVNGAVEALSVYDGGGSALYAGGSFTSAGGVGANRIARWDGASWSALGSGTSDDVEALAVYDDGSGPLLYIAHQQIVSSRVIKWDGTSLSAFGNGNSNLAGDVLALAVFEDGSGPALCAGGSFESAGSVEARGIASWNGSTWSRFGDGGLDRSVEAMLVFDDGDGAALYVGGRFTSVEDAPANRFLRSDGTSWSTPGANAVAIHCLAGYDDRGGPELYAGGVFDLGGQGHRVARWDGSSWSAVGGMMNDDVLALAAHDDGGGPALYAGGEFISIGGAPASRVARWDGSSWSEVGGGLLGTVHALAVFDDGGGPALYAGGGFFSPGLRIVKWDGSSWTAVGSGTNGEVHALAVYDDGNGPALYACGAFAAPGLRIAKWDGSSWSPLGAGLGPAGFLASYASDLTVFDDSNGPALYVGGDFTSAGGLAANRIARWDGSSWSALGGGTSGPVRALAGFHVGGVPTLFCGGLFLCFDTHDTNLAQWVSCQDTTPPVLSCPLSVTVPDGHADGPGEVVSFSVTATDDLDPSPDVVCAPPSGSLFPLGTTLVQCTATDASGNQDTCQFPVTVEPKARRRKL